MSPAGGQHQDPDHQHDEDLAAREPVLRKRDGGEEREHDRGDHRDAHDDQAVLDGVPEERAVDRVAEVIERRRGREPRRRQAVDLVVRLERRRDHPEDREDEHDEERDPDEVPGPPAEPRLAAAGAELRRRCSCVVLHAHHASARRARSARRPSAASGARSLRRGRSRSAHSPRCRCRRPSGSSSRRRGRRRSGGTAGRTRRSPR